MKKNKMETNKLRQMHKKELISINGGDKFMYDVGRALGYFFSAICDLPPGSQIRGH